MAFEKFNSVGGFSVGIPPYNVIDNSGNITTNSVTSNAVYANIIYANNIPIVPGGDNNQIQFNTNGVFSGNPNFTYGSANNTLTVNGSITTGSIAANLITISSGFIKIHSTQFTTNSTIPNQVLFSISSTNVAGIDFTIISTDVSANTRNFTKISSVQLDNEISFKNYVNLDLNSSLANFNVGLNAGAIQLTTTPNTVNEVVHKIMVLAYYG